VSGDGDGVVHVAESLVDGHGGVDALDVLEGAQGVGEAGALAFEHLHLEAERLGDDEDVGEDDGGVQLGEAVDGLHGDGHREGGRAADLKEGVLFAHGLEFREETASLR